MSRRGRKRKSGPRYNSGDPLRDRPPSPQEVASMQPHRRFAPLEHRDHPHAETALGMLHLIGALTHDEYRAATTFAGIVRRYRAVICAPPPHPASIAGIFEARQRGSGDIPDAVERKRDYDGATEALGEAGRSATIVVDRVAVHGEPVPYRSFGLLVRGLRVLREHFELTSRGKLATVGK